MSRRILTGSVNRSENNAVYRGGAADGQPQPNGVDDFLGRLVKYIPAEIVGLYVAARGLPSQGTGPAVYLIIAIASWVLVPIYFYFATTRDGQRPLKQQIVLATIAFPIWVFAIGGPPVNSLPWFVSHQYVASIVLMFATVIFGRIAPPPGA